MGTAAKRQQLHDYLEAADEKKVKAIYTMVEDTQTLKIFGNLQRLIYTDELKAELDRRLEYYLNGGKMVTPEEMSERLKAILRSPKTIEE